jgi:hypothetical protein
MPELSSVLFHPLTEYQALKRKPDKMRNLLDPIAIQVPHRRLSSFADEQGNNAILRHDHPQRNLPQRQRRVKDARPSRDAFMAAALRRSDEVGLGASGS